MNDNNFLIEIKKIVIKGIDMDNVNKSKIFVELTKSSEKNQSFFTNSSFKTEV